MFLNNVQVGHTGVVNKRTGRKYVLPIVILTVIAAVSYWSFYAPILYSDDWSLMLGRWYFDNLQWFDLTEQRPLLKVCLVILYSIFGLNVHAFYVVLWALIVLNTIQLYFLLLRLIPQNVAIAFSIAAIVLVYPADLTHMWLTMIQIRAVVVMTLLYAHLLLIYADTERRIVLGGALLCLVVSLGIYEAQLGVAMAWCVLVILIKRPASWKSRLNLSLPLVVGVVFLSGRLFSYLFWGIGPQDYFSRFVFTPARIIENFMRGYRLMVWAWVEPLRHAFGLNEWQAMAILLLMVALFIFVAYLLSRVCRKLQGHYLTQQEHSAQMRCFMLLALIGPVFVTAGYIPVIAFFRPTLFHLHSRLNLLPLMGAAVALVALLAVVVLLLSRKQRQINLMALAGTVPLIILGVMVQARVQYDDRAAWEEQKQIWHQLFGLAPDFQSNARVIFVVPENKEQSPSFNPNGQHLPFAGGWDISTGLNMLYGRYDLSGDLAAEESFFKEGIKSYYGDKITPYNQGVVLAYDRKQNQLRIVEDLKSENLVDFSISDYTPYEHIINTPTTRVAFRWLVGIEVDE